MRIETHVLATWIVVDIIICGANYFGVDGGRKAGFRFYNDIGHGLISEILSVD